MLEPDLSKLKVRSIFGIKMFGSIRNIGIVDSISNGIIKAHALRGQFNISFATSAGGSTIPSRRLEILKEKPELLNGLWAKGLKIGFVGDLELDQIEFINNLDSQLTGMSALTAKRFLANFEDEITDIIKCMNNAANDSLPDYQMSFAI